jgi:hypothetical protein
MTQNIEHSKLELIQWILSLNTWHSLEMLLSFKNSLSNKEDLFFSLCGSWQSDEDGDELNQSIYQARNDQAREIEL